MNNSAFTTLEKYLSKIPAVVGSIASGTEDKSWWIKFKIDIEHNLAWHVIQELGHVLNYLSLDERLPTVFKPVSPPPYMNGGPKDFLFWVIECDDIDFKPDTVANWLEARLPRPVEDIEQWNNQSNT